MYECVFSLQVNSSGAWKNVAVSLTKDQMVDIEHHAAMMAKVIGKSHKWRIIETGLNRVIGYCESPDFEWVPPKHGVSS